MNTRHPQGKFNTGSIRGELPQEGRWYEDRAQGRQIASDFTAAPGMVPSNPVNFQSARPVPSTFQYDAIANGLTTYGNPYGDGRTFLRGEEPLLTTPGPAASLIQAAAPAADAAAQSRTPGYGYGANSPLARIDAAQQLQPPAPLGMSTSPKLTASGPQRDVPRDAA